MANISRYDPFDFTVEPFDDLFRGFFRPVRAANSEAAVQIKMDVKEDDQAYTVQAEVPGVKKEDIHVTIDGNQVSLTAEAKRQTEDKDGEKLLRSERYYGKAYRSFTLGSDIDDAAAEAKYNDGVLELRLPKKAATSARRLEIH
ncbi:heat-shock protein Hsp20 [Sulfuriferula plumbiphila]|uniref:Heat-shock protein Hsp20 n=1 Tax=Sulfuriferula plumbiphila TaxID=171865 RepID=A0A512LBG9_9PROT|nr:Hsp20/alpha crystallin family protein [Sulfuriferula plumbiphila]BBP06033.1 heat-shock protein Hsp20 [Sulfuriferula plumbiphila]GEP31825.1 heat-shock protein Hsp20 [Sulfuriferula plumbiphila]